MELDPSLVEALRCPESGQKLRVAPAELVASVNAKITAGIQRNRAGHVPAKAISGGLLREDGAVLYPLVDGFPILLIEEGLPVAG